MDTRSARRLLPCRPNCTGTTVGGSVQRGRCWTVHHWRSLSWRGEYAICNMQLDLLYHFNYPLQLCSIKCNYIIPGITHALGLVRAAGWCLVRPTCGRTGSRWNVRFGHQRGPTGRGWGRGWPRGRRGQRVNRPEHTPKKCDGCEDNFTALKLISKVFLFDDETYFSHILTEKFLFSKSKIEVSVSKASVLVLEQVGCLYQQWTLSTWTDISGNAFRWQKQTFDAFNVFYCWCDFVVPSDKLLSDGGSKLLKLSMCFTVDEILLFLQTNSI